MPSATGLTVEFPWEVGACSAMVGDCTSLLQVRADMPHPLAGNGLYYRLDLPVNVTEEEAMRCAVELNRFETEGVDTPPFFGAWCYNSKINTLSFVGFWPNLMYQFGTVANIAFWCGVKEPDCEAGDWESVIGGGRTAVLNNLGSTPNSFEIYTAGHTVEEGKRQ